MDHHFEKMEQLLQLNTKMKGVYVECGNKGQTCWFCAAYSFKECGFTWFTYQHMYDDTFLLKRFRAVWIHALMKKNDSQGRPKPCFARFRAKKNSI